MIKPPRRALALWRVRALLITFLPAFLCSLVFRLFSPLWFIFNGVWIAAFLYFYCFWYPIKWKKLSFCLTEKILYINNGVVYTHRRFIRVKNLQYVGTYQSPLMKLAGLASVVMKAPGVSMYLPSLYKETAEELYAALSAACLKRDEEGGGAL